VEDVQAFVSDMVKDLFKELNELVSLEAMGLMVQGDETSGRYYAFSDASADVEARKDVMDRASDRQEMIWDEDAKVWLIPLCVEVGDESRLVGRMALWCTSGNASEDDRLMLELVASYVAIVVYHVVELMAGKLKDVEEAQDENHRVVSEKNRLHVQNLVLDNCLSTIKHETLYYPNRIRQIVNALQVEGVGEAEERKQVETIGELAAYYKEVFTILSSCASRQLEEITFRRTVVSAGELAESASKYLRKKAGKSSCRIELRVQADPVQMVGDASLLKFMLESLMDEALSHPCEGLLELHIYKEGTFVRFDFIDRRRTLGDEELEQLFAPNRAGVQGDGEGVLAGTEYLVCKQIVRDHDEYAGRRGCRMNASQASGGGFMVWFTIPAK
jgi:K+-sensing histidine kinase KdpD